MTKEELKKRFTEETGLYEIECNSSEYADWLENKILDTINNNPLNEKNF